MSRSQPQVRSNADYQDIPESQRHYIGRDKPSIEVSVQKPDRYEYERWQTSRRLGIPEWELPDTPDYDNRLDNIDEGS